MPTAAQERLIRPARNIIGSLRLPGDKSISHRYAMLGGFAEGTSRFTNFSTGADCASTLACMESLGAKVNRTGADSIEITGVAGRVTPPANPLDCGNSGSTMRMISGLLAPQSGRFTLIGDDSLSRRPMERIRKPLEAMGARLTLTDGHAPLTIDGGPLRAIDYATPVPSAQVKSCILLAALQTAGNHNSARSTSAPATTASWPCAPSAQNSPAHPAPSPSPARSRSTQSMPQSPAIFPRQHFSSAPPRSFPAPAWSSTPSASIPPAPRSSMCSPPSARTSPS